MRIRSRNRIRRISCSRCCGVPCQGKKRVAAGFAPSMRSLIESKMKAYALIVRSF